MVTENLNELELLSVRVQIKENKLSGFYVIVSPRYGYLFEHSDNEYEIGPDGVMSDWPTYIHPVIGETVLFNESHKLMK